MMASRDKFISKAYEVAMLLFVIAIPFPIIYTNLAFILLSLIWLAEARFKSKITNIKNKPLFFLFQSLYVLFVLSLFNTECMSDGWRSVEKTLPMFAMPLILSTASIKVSPEILNRLLNTYVFSCFIACMLCLVYASFLQVSNHGWSISSFEWELFTYHNFTDILDLSSVYISIFVAFAFLIVLWKLPKYLAMGSKWLLSIAVLLLLFFLIMLLLFSVRMQLLSIMVLLIFSTLWYTFLQRKIAVGIGVIASMLLMFFLMFTYNPTLNYKVKEAINYNNEYRINQNWGGRALRLLKWDCAKDIILSYPIFGVGMGDAQDQLSNCYREKNYTPLYHRKGLVFNAHNQYLEFGVSLGGIGLLLFITTLLVPFFLAIRQKKYLYALFILMCSFSFITESVLQRHKGIVFYSFFNAVFAFHLLENKREKESYELQ